MTTYGVRASALLAILSMAAGIATPTAAAGPSAAVAPAPYARAPAPPDGVPTPADAARMPAVVAPVSGFRWPLDGAPAVVRRFEPPPQPWSPGHRGVDLTAAPGAMVRAAGGGTVLFAGRIAGRGVVSVAHAGGLRTTYEPVEPRVTAGRPLAAGDPIGVLSAGHPGCPVAACLHWGLRRSEQYLDPLSLLGLGRLRLLPVQRNAASRAGRRRARLSYSSARL